MPLAGLHIPHSPLSAQVSNRLYLLPQQFVTVMWTSYTPRLCWHSLCISLSKSVSPWRATVRVGGN